MDWSQLNGYGDSPDRAFEAVVGNIFEVWVAHSYGADVLSVKAINGAGGDGGVEALAELRSGASIGIQAKWFRAPIGSSQVSQIRDSYAKACKAHPTLTAYIVAIPRDLADGRPQPRSTRRRIRQPMTERMRWDAFVKKYSLPRTPIILWQSSTVIQHASKLLTQGAIKYWFGKCQIHLEHLRLTSDRAESGWLAQRYYPDLHTAGLIQRDLRQRLYGSKPTASERRASDGRLSRIAVTVAELERLHRLPGYDQIENAQALVLETLASLKNSAEQYSVEINSLTEGGVVRSVVDSAPATSAIRKLEAAIEGVPSQSRHDTLARLLNDAAIACVEMEEHTARLFRLVGPPIYVGAPGAGKTHALATAVREHLDVGGAGIILRGKDASKCASITAFLRTAFDEPSWTLTELMDSCFATAVHAEHRAVLENNSAPRAKFLIAIDGIDESLTPEQWSEWLGEVVPIAKRWSRVLFAVSARERFFSRMQLSDAFTAVHIGESDADITKLFDIYVQDAGITCPRSMRWALRSPIALRIFSEIYRGQVLALDSTPLAIDKLILAKIRFVDDELRQIASRSWAQSSVPTHTVLVSFVRRFASAGEPLSDVDVSAVIADVESAFLSQEQAAWILEMCAERGLLRQEVLNGTATSPHSRQWEPAHEILTDYLLAQRYVESLSSDTNAPRTLPDWMQWRSNAQLLVASILGQRAEVLLENGLWKDSLNEEDAIRLRATALLHSTANPDSVAWARSTFSSSMPSCRALLTSLVVPASYGQNSAYNGLFVHSVLIAQSMAERDQYWSVPDYMPFNHGAKWEGNGDSFSCLSGLEPDEPWHGRPLVAAWCLTSLVEDTRRSMREQISRWGAYNPLGLSRILGVLATVDDGQLLENLLCAVYGAAILADVDQQWEVVVNALTRCAGDYCYSTPWNVDVAHFLRAIFTRIGVALDKEYEVPQVKGDETLAIDVEVAKTCTSRSYNAGPLHGDLIWYVVKTAIEPFVRSGSAPAFQREEKLVRRIRRVRVSLLNDLVERRVRPRASKLAIEAARRELRRASKAILLAQAARRRNRLARYIATLTTDELEALARSLVRQNSPATLETTTRAASQFEHYVHALGASIGFDELSADQFALGFCAQRVTALGWDAAIHFMEPKGEAVGERLGLDVAILRRYGEARHGSRSGVAQAAEKYCWIARHELVGFLAARFPIADYYEAVGAPVDPANFVELPVPSNDAVGVAVHVEFVPDPWRSICAPMAKTRHGRGVTQLEIANEWVKNPVQINAKDVVCIPAGGAISERMRGHDWLVLSANVAREDAYSLGTATLWASAWLAPLQAGLLLEEDAGRGCFPDLHDYSAGIARAEHYCDPDEMAWAPWHREIQSVYEYWTLSDQGEPKKVDLLATHSKFMWQSRDGEASLSQPSRRLRKLLDIRTGTGGCFLNGDNELVVVRTDEDVLLARMDKLCAALRRARLEVWWGLRIWTEPSTRLYVESGRVAIRYVRRNWCAAMRGFQADGRVAMIPIRGEDDSVNERNANDE